MTSPTPFDTALLRRRKARAAPRFAEAAFLHRSAAEDLAERLEAIPRRFERTLLLGTGLFREALAARPSLAQRVEIIAHADVASALIGPRGAAVSLERLPFRAEAFDLIVSPLALHWANDLPGVFAQMRLLLQPDGLMLASLLGGDTLVELRRALIIAETEVLNGAGVRVAPFATLEDMTALLQRTGFALPAADRDRLRVSYRDPLRLFQDLRAMGETNMLVARAGPLRRAALMRTLELLSETPAITFDVLTATGWAPAPSQPKPLRPGSARARLADALGVKEQDPERDV